MRRPLLAALALLLVVAACRGGGAPQGARAHGRPVVLVSVDTLRSDRLPAYGYRGVATPALDALAADSILVERAYSHYPVTLPSHATIFTGLLPPQHGVRNNKGYFLDERHVTLAERLRAAGYRTGGVVSSMVLGRPTGIAQGFDHFDDPAPSAERPRVMAQSRGEASVALARRWLDQVPVGERFFLFLHLFDPHTPYAAPEPWASRYSPYDAEVAYTDHLVGTFLEDLKRRGLYDGSVVVFLSDHGEGLGDHVEKEHGVFLYREALQVPLMFKLPGRERAGQRLSGPAALYDVAPTLLALLGVDRGGLPGAALLEGRPPAPDRPVYSETFLPREQYGWSALKSVISADGHYIQAPRPELYDVVRDPAETTNLLLAKRVPPSMVAAIAAVGEGTRSTRPVSREEEERLAALGYVGGGDTSDLPSDLPDPKDHVAKAMELWDAMEQVGRTESLEPEERVKRLLGELGIRREYLSRVIAQNLVRAGRPRAALEVLQPFAASEDADTQLVLGEASASVGRLADARRLFEAVLARHPDSAAARRNMGILLLGAGRPEEARPWLEGALERDAASAEAWNALGVVRAQGADVAGAVAAWREAVRHDPALADAWFNVAVALRRQGDTAGARQALERYLPLVKGTDRQRAQAMLQGLR